MHTLHLKVNDSIYEHLMAIIKSMKSNDIEIVDDVNEPQNTKQQLKALFETSNQDAFKSIDDPVAWQRTQRDEW